METVFFKVRFARFLAVALAPLAVALAAIPAIADPSHGIAMYGEPALPPDFVSLPYANPDAPKGGGITMGENGSYDSLNPYIVKGVPAAGVAALTVETLLGRSYAEPFALYGLLAESVDTDAARTWVEFTLRDGARFSDGAPVTVEDVIWSVETLGTQGAPRYQNAWKAIEKAEQTGPRSVRFTFNSGNRELPLILGLRPILQKASWQGKDFTATTLTPPIGSGPYLVDKVDPGKSITFRRNPDWWGKDLPFNRGQWNFDTIRYDYFGDGLVAFESFKAGDVSVFRETNAAKWANSYDFPALSSGKVIKAEIPYGTPSGIEGFAFNLRKPLFADWRVREALTLAFNYELVNSTLYAGALPRISSYFGGSGLAGDMANPAQGPVLDLLTPYQANLLPGAVEGYALPPSDGSEANRKNLRRAMALLEEAGLTVNDGVLTTPEGQPFAFEILLQTGQDDVIKIANIYVEALKRLGVEAKITTVDSTQMKERTTNFDFDMTYYVRRFSLSPGTEQLLYWASEGAAQPGSRNWMGIASPAVDGLMQTMLAATTPDQFTAAVQALDRVLTSGRYVIPFGYSPVSRLAYDAGLHYPAKLPIYGDYPGFLPDVWWYQE